MATFSTPEVGKLLDRAIQQAYQDGQGAFGRLMEAERRATHISAYTLGLFPDILHTKAYAVANRPRSWDAASVEHTRVGMLRNEEIMARGVPLDVLVGEQALYNTIEDSAAMSEQLQHVRSLAQQPQIQVRLVPTPRASHIRFEHSRISYVLLELPDQADPVTYFEGQNAAGDPWAQFSTDPDEVSRSLAAWEHHSSMALSAALSLSALALQANALNAEQL